MPQSTKDRIKEITNRLEEGIRDVFESGKYETYLRTMSRFHSYSMNNTILIYMQKPDATHVAGFHSWQQKFNRSVMKGQKGIQILAPAPYQKTVTMEVFDKNMRPVLDANGNQVQKTETFTIPAFKPVTVFDVSQTEGEPLPELAKTLNGEVDHYQDFLEALTRASASPIGFKELPSNLDGFFHLKEKTITIREGMSEQQTVCAIIHEITHSRLHDKSAEAPEERKDNRTMEVEAESVAFAVCAYYGIETGENSFGYIASWSKDKDLPELKKSLETISKTASGLISDIDAARSEIEKKRDGSDMDLTDFPVEPNEMCARKEACL